jgi:hypothetical protein
MLEAEYISSNSATGRIRSIEKSKDLIWNQTRDLPACKCLNQLQHFTGYSKLYSYKKGSYLAALCIMLLTEQKECLRLVSIPCTLLREIPLSGQWPHGNSVKTEALITRYFRVETQMLCPNSDVRIVSGRWSEFPLYGYWQVHFTLLGIPRRLSSLCKSRFLKSILLFSDYRDKM